MKKAKKLPKVVCMGGGTGLPVVLQSLKNYPLDVTAIVTVADDGGSSGRLRSDFGLPPPGDLRNALVALSDADMMFKEVIQYRFKKGELKGHNVGNLMFAALNNITGNFKETVEVFSSFLNVRGKVLPLSQEKVTLVAETVNGCFVLGESKIPLNKEKIKRVFLEPKNVKPLEEVILALKNADFIIVGPGSLYTSVLPCLILQDVLFALKESRATKVYICNIMTQKGETEGFKASDHLKVIYKHLHFNPFDVVILNKKNDFYNSFLKFETIGQEFVYQDVENINKYFNLKIVLDDLVNLKIPLRHDVTKLGSLLFSFFK